MLGRLLRVALHQERANGLRARTRMSNVLLGTVAHPGSRVRAALGLRDDFGGQANIPSVQASLVYRRWLVVGRYSGATNVLQYVLQ